MEQRVDVETLAIRLGRFIDAFNPVMTTVSRVQWQPQDGPLQLVSRAILVRQYESVRAAVNQAQGDFGFATVLLLRPSCEELIWVKYLKQLDLEIAQRLLQCIVTRELDNALDETDKFWGREVLIRDGLYSAWEQLGLSRELVAKELKEISKRLNWQNRRNNPLPSVYFLAKETGMQDTYRYLYAATSRFVHFSPMELLRRSWGKPSEMVLSSSTFSRYWSAFALTWGYRLFMDTYIELESWIPETKGIELDADGDEILDIIRWFGEFGVTHIVTKDELSWRSLFD